MMAARALDEITGGIVDAAYKIHTGLDPSASPREPNRRRTLAPPLIKFAKTRNEIAPVRAPIVSAAGEAL